MSYLRQAFTQLYEQDGVLVMGRGLGIRHVLAKFVRFFCSGVADEQESQSSEQGQKGDRPKKRLVFVINAKGEEDLLLDSLLADGVHPGDLPQILTNEFSIRERTAMYKEGGVFIVTSRILIVDFLNNVVDPSSVSGFLVHHAHRVEETSTEAFILRIFRQKSRSGFVKGFCEDPEALTRGFGKAEKVLRALHVQKLYLWPRFQSEVTEALDRRKPAVMEMWQELTPGMMAVQQAVAVAMDVCLAELRKRAPMLDVTDLTVENGLFEAFDSNIRRQLDPEWHKVRPDTKQLVSDLGTLRKLLDFMFRYDCVTFYSFLQTVRSASAQQRNPSQWLSMEAAERLFTHAKARVFKVVAAPSEPRSKTKKAAAATTAAAGTTAATAAAADSGTTATAMQSSANVADGESVEDATAGAAAGATTAGVTTAGADGAESSAVKISSSSSATNSSAAPATAAAAPTISAAASAAASMRVVPVLEENPKWALVEEVLQTTRKELLAEQQKQSTRGQVAGGSALLIMVKDESTAAQLQEHLTLGGKEMMQRRFLRYLTSTNAKARRVQAKAGTTDSSSSSTTKSSSSGGGGGGSSSGRGSYSGRGYGRGGYSGGRGRGSYNSSSSSNSASSAQQSAASRAVAVERELLLQEEERLRELLQGHHSAADTAADSDSDAGKSGKGSKGKKRAGKSSTAATATGTATTAAAGKKGKGKGKAKAAAASTTAGGSSSSKAVAAKAKPAAKRKSRAGGDTPRSEGQGETAASRKRKRAAQEKQQPGDERELDETYEAEALLGERGLLGTVLADGEGDSDGGNRAAAAAAAAVQLTCEQLPQLHAVLYTYAQAAERLSLLDEVQPRAVLLYDPDMAFIRSVELFQATRSEPAPPLTVNFAVYENSAEHQRYLTAVRRETRAFETLVEQKGMLVVPTFIVDAPASGSEHARAALSLDTRTGPRAAARRAAAKGPPRVVVDVREFRSALPSLLHARGIGLAPHTITVGDYILSPELCVERKSVGDLFSSFASGRLWNQAEAMSRWYKRPALLIEFAADKTFCLQTAGELSSDLKVDGVCSKMALLAMHFPALRVLWSRSPHATVDIFESLMTNEAPVDVAKALAAGDSAGVSGTQEGGEDEGSSGGGAGGLNQAAQDLLLRLPGVSVSNYRDIMRSVECVADLATMSLAALQPIMGQVGARRLHSFFREQANL